MNRLDLHEAREEKGEGEGGRGPWILFTSLHALRRWRTFLTVLILRMISTAISNTMKRPSSIETDLLEERRLRHCARHTALSAAACLPGPCSLFTLYSISLDTVHSCLHWNWYNAFVLLEVEDEISEGCGTSHLLPTPPCHTPSRTLIQVLCC